MDIASCLEEAPTTYTVTGCSSAANLNNLTRCSAEFVLTESTDCNVTVTAVNAVGMGISSEEVPVRKSIATNHSTV